MTGNQPIVVGYDGSECAKAALKWAAGIAKATGDRLVLVFGYEPYQMGGEVQDHREALKEFGRDAEEQGQQVAQNLGVSAEVKLVDDRPTQALVATVEELGARMIVVGTYGDSPIKGAILGSTPHKLLQVSPVPVLVVPAGED